jgi:lysophospholipase L1-like esterase
MLGRDVPWSNVSISGTSWSTLATTAVSRADHVIKNADKTVLIMCGGTSDVLENDSAATILSDMESYANNRRAAGVDYIINTTITGYTSFTGPQEAVRVAANALIEASSVWDAVVDLAAVPELDDPTDVTYYSGGLHWTAAGAQVVADEIAPALDEALEALASINT